MSFSGFCCNFPRTLVCTLLETQQGRSTCTWSLPRSEEQTQAGAAGISSLPTMPLPLYFTLAWPPAQLWSERLWCKFLTNLLQNPPHPPSLPFKSIFSVSFQPLALLNWQPMKRFACGARPLPELLFEVNNLLRGNERRADLFLPKEEIKFTPRFIRRRKSTLGKKKTTTLLPWPQQHLPLWHVYPTATDFWQNRTLLFRGGE